MNPLLRKLRATPFVALLIFVPLAAAAVSLSVGRYAVHLGDALEIIFRVVKRGYAAAASVDPQERIIIGVRLPRVLLGLLVGGGLSVAGAGMQALLSNPLVSPDTLGVASGACFGAALALILNGGLVAVQLTAMAFGVVAMLITYKAGKNRRETSIIMLVLAGMVVNSLFQAFVSLIKYTADSEAKLPEITYWLLGSLNGATWKGLRLGMPVILAGTLVLIMLRWKCNVLTLSDDEARSLGVDLKKIRALIIVAATAVIASCVSMCGPRQCEHRRGVHAPARHRGPQRVGIGDPDLHSHGGHRCAHFHCAFEKDGRELAMTFEVRNGCFGYKKTVPILKNISFCVESRQVLAVLGPNGVGKTTLLRSMMGMLPWTSGGSFLDGENIRDMTPGRLWQEMAYVPQAKSFPFAFTVEEMILLGRSSRIGTFGTPEKADRERCERAMEELGIAHMRRKLCNQISGGELQMVLIARALCAEPKLLVLDEPESNLDFRNQLIILETIRRLSREEGLCCIFNTHYPGHALRISDRALVLSREGTADFGEPSEVITREIMGRVFKVNVDIVDAQYDGMDYQAITAISLCNT